MRNILKPILLIRPHNVAAAVLSVATGYWLASGSIRQSWVLLTAVALVTSAGNVINDYFDHDIDSINKPRRVLPSGAVSLDSARQIYIGILAGLFITLMLLPVQQSVWIGVWAILLHLYSANLKRLCFAGNLLVSVVTGSGFLIGSMAGGDLSAGIIPASFTFFFVMGRELVKDCEDMPGDRACGARTLPVIAGKEAVMKIAAAIFIFLAAAFPVPWLLDIYSDRYGLVIMISVLPILVVSFIFALRGSRPGLVSLLLKVGMFFGITAFLLGSTG